MLTAGIDIGSTGAKAVILDGEEIRSYSIIPTGGDSVKTAEKVMGLALEKAEASLEDIQYIVSTGYGRVLVPFADKNVTEISCHARGVVTMYPSVRTILDIGGQDCKVISCDKNGLIDNFVLNEKCAAGTGRFLELCSKTLDIPVQDIGKLTLDLEREVPKINSVCVLFTKSEILRLVRDGVDKVDIMGGALDALVERIYSLIHKIGCRPDFMITGGVAKNAGIVKRIEAKTKTKVLLAPEPQIMGAYGAALYANAYYKKKTR